MITANMWKAAVVAAAFVLVALGLATSPSGAAPGDTIAGTVFDDLNENGTNDAEAGVAGVTVTAYDSTGAAVGTDTTAGDGSYTVTIGAGAEDGPYRLEFTTLPAGMASSPVGTDSATTVQFVPDGPQTGVDLGVFTPETCGGSLVPTNALLRTYQTAATCGVIASSSARDTLALFDVSGSVPASGRSEDTTAPNFHHPTWEIDQLGNVYGTAIDTRRGDFFVTASTNYGQGFYRDGDALNQWGSIGLAGVTTVEAAGTIFILDAVSGAATVFARLPQQSIDFEHRDCEDDDRSPLRTSGVGLGNAAYDPTNDQLFVSNWEDGRIYRLAMDGTILDAYDPDATDDGTAGYANGSVPYGLAVSPDGTRLFWGTMDTTVPNPVVSIDLLAGGTFPGTATASGLGYDHYEDATETAHTLAVPAPTSPFGVSDLRNWVADLEFLPNGDLLVGLRTGCNEFASSYNHNATTYRLSEGAGGIFGSATELPMSVDLGTLRDHYGGVAYYDTGGGSYLHIQSTGDALVEGGPHGIVVAPSSATGTPLEPAGVVSYIPGLDWVGGTSDPKGMGGDVQAANWHICSRSPIEIGNLVWFDANGDGQQGPDEPGLADVTVGLFDSTGNLITSVVTDSTGNYLFSGYSGTDTAAADYGVAIDPNTQYTVAILDSEFAPGGTLDVHAPTTADVEGTTNDETDNSDSDGVAVTVGSGADEATFGVTFTTGLGGDNNHTFDLGVTLRPPDLALAKTVDTGATTFPLAPGDPVTFTITVTNQGPPVEDFTVVDYIDTTTWDAFAAADNADGTTGGDVALPYTWDSTDPANPVASVDGVVGAGQSVTIPVTLRIPTDYSVTDGTPLVNWAEISSFDDDGDPGTTGPTDADSTPDDTQGNDNQPTDLGEPGDDEIAGDGTGTDPVADDEDDHDVAGVEIYDLALRKILDPAQTLPVVPGDGVTFLIEVINQGSLHAQDVVVGDYVDLTTWDAFSVADNPAGTTTGDQALPYTWTADGTDGEVTVTGLLAPGETLRIPVTLTVAATADLEDMENVAEIRGGDPTDDTGAPVTNPDGSTPTDVDSTPDDTDGNDGPVDDDEVANANSDEDDHDIAVVEPPTYSLGNQVWFDTDNDGIIDADEVGVAAVVVELFADDDADGLPDDQNGDGVIDSTDALETTTTDADGLYLFTDLEPGDYIVGIPGDMWDEGGPLRGTLSSDPTSSAPNDDVDNDDNGFDNMGGYVVSGRVTLGDGEPTGEDPDNDPTTPDLLENLTVDFGFWTPVYDLALRKQLDDGSNDRTVEVGDLVTFTITVLNQGDVSAADIELVDYVPDGLELQDDDWTLDGEGRARRTLTGVTLAAGGSTEVSITFRVTADATGTVVNTAEIADSEPRDDGGFELVMPNGESVPDVDSTEDDTDTEDPVDDEVDNGSGDEDDHDVAEIQVLAQPPTDPDDPDDPEVEQDPLARSGSNSLYPAGFGAATVVLGFLLLYANRRYLAYLHRPRHAKPSV